jgi:cytoskeleton protein RodZ
MKEERLMSEYFKTHGLGANQESSLSDVSPASAGQMLKQARLDAGLHIAALAVSLKVPVKRIEALENGHFELLPDMVFVRALTSSICQALKIDSTPILGKLPKASLPKLNHDDVAISRRIDLTSTGKTSAEGKLFKSTWLIGFLLLCMGAAGIYFWPKFDSIGLPSMELPSISLLPKNQHDVGVSQAREELVPTESLVASKSATTSLAVPPAPSVLPNMAPANTPDSTAVSVASVASTENLVIFKASGQTWVEVKNVRGNTIFKKLLNEGEVAGTNGALPLAVTVGKADATKVEIRGKPLDLVPLTKNNVAKFEVN